MSQVYSYIVTDSTIEIIQSARNEMQYNETYLGQQNSLKIKINFLAKAVWPIKRQICHFIQLVKLSMMPAWTTPAKHELQYNLENLGL